MTTADQLYKTVISTTKAPTIRVVEYLKAEAKELRSIPWGKLCKTSGSSQFRDPKEPGELAAARIFHVLVSQDVLPQSLDEIMTIAQQLVSYTNDQFLWEELLARIDSLEASAAG